MTESSRRDRQTFKQYRLTEKHGLGLGLFFSHGDLPPDAPIYVFQHTMKTGGTSLRALIYRNHAEDLTFDPQLMPKWSPDLTGLYRRIWTGLGDRRRRLVWAASHSAAHLLPRLDRPVEGITIVRDPLSRALSRFAFGHRQQRDIGELSTLIDGIATRGVDPTGLRGTVGRYSNPQSRWLLAPFHDVEALPTLEPSAGERARWRRLLVSYMDTHYQHVLLQDKFTESVTRLARHCGWRHHAPPHLRLNKWRLAGGALPDDLRHGLRAINWLDDELYRYALERFARGASSETPATAQGQRDSQAGTATAW
jgi:hypothetical protein